MRPRNKTEQDVLKMSQKLPNASKSVKEYIYTRLMPKVAYKSSNKGWCSECGNVFESERMKDGSIEVCPHCGAVLKVKGSMKRTDTFDDYLVVPMVVNGWQVMRYLYIVKNVRKGEVPRYEIHDVSQHWTKPTGQDVVLQLSRLMQGWYCRQPFALHSEMSIKKDFSVEMGGKIKSYPYGKILPMYRKMGVTADFHEISPIDLIRTLRKSPLFETMLKKGWYNAMSYFTYRPESFKVIEPAVRIAMRYGYDISDFNMYYDYITACLYCGVDIRNPKFACPVSLKESHDKMIERKVRREEAKMVKEKSKANESYINDKGKFFNLKASDGDLYLVVLKSIIEFKHEGDILHHCVFKNSYYEKKNSLILSARIDGKSIETIELSLKDFKVLQCHGDHNNNSCYHDRIMKLVNNCIPSIRKIARKSA